MAGDVLNGKELGKLHSAHGFLKDKLVLDFYGWTLQRKSVGKYQVFDNWDSELAVFSSKIFKFSQFTFIDFKKSEDEAIISLLAMAVCAQSKSEIRKEK